MIKVISSSSSLTTTTTTTTAVKNEKRASRLVSRPTQKIIERIQRALSQRLYLINQEDLSTPNNLSREYNVLGSTGNVYDVTISKRCSCTCPDEFNCCKHILFVFLRVLKVNRNSHVIFQNALLQDELATIFSSKANHDGIIIIYINYNYYNYIIIL